MTSFSKLSYCLMLLLALLGIGCVSKPVRKQEVIARGVGTSLQEAKNDAIRQGIQFLVGSYVTSDLESMNDAIIKDKVTDYSGAVVDQFEVLNQERRADGLYELRARMQITGDAGRQRNRSAISKPGQVDGQSLHAEALSQFKLKADTIALWENALAGFPGRAFKYVVFNPSMDTLPNNNEQVSLNFYSAEVWRMDFLNELKTVLKATGHPVQARNGVPYGIQWISEAPGDQQTGICLMSGFKTNLPWQNVECYIVNLPSQQFDKWLCFKTGATVSFDIRGFNANGLEFFNRTRKDLMPYLTVDHNGRWSTFIFYVVDKNMITERIDYQEHISALWSFIVPVDALPDIKNISARGECLKD